MPPVNRRYFIRAAASSLFILPGIPAIRTAAAAPPADCFFYDERFAEAQRLAKTLAPAGRLVPVQGDVTAIWTGGLDRACLRAPLTLHGVTTESFHFCLKLMVGSRTGVDTSASRISRDLFLWTLRSGAHIHSGIRA
jgi:hypothetical protein